jgi:hypothetical protein
MATSFKTEDLSQLSLSETDLGGTGCGKSARPDLWGCGKVTNRTTRRFIQFIPYTKCRKSEKAHAESTVVFSQQREQSLNLGKKRAKKDLSCPNKKVSFVKNSLSISYRNIKRRERDSNPRSREGQRFSRPPHSTTLPSLLMIFRPSHPTSR